MKFYTVCTLPHYHPEDVYMLRKQLLLFYDGEVELFVYTDRPALFNDTVNVIAIDHHRCKRQWYKMDFFGPHIVKGSEPVIVTDLDWTIIDDVTSIIDVPIDRDEFVAIDRWWRKDTCKLTLNGGMYKFFPNTCLHAYNTFYSNPEFWQTTYFGPNNIKGEQNFVADIIPISHNVTYFPGKKIGRYSSDPADNVGYARYYHLRFNEPMMVQGRFNRQLALLHARPSSFGNLANHHTSQ